ncbi:MAG TPA: hypothetical protein VH143_34000 [Kofleriaceae bacterium]|jgi:hypothetical protein|nr:hypothetical protein [Kofleriaceae bacterium]
MASVASRAWFGRAVLIAWFVVVTVGSAGLLARHLLALPAPAPTSDLGARLLALRGGAPGTWVAVHVLGGDCRCSQRIADHLIASARPAGWAELVLWIGDSPPSGLEQHFDVRRVDAARLAALGIEAAPLLVAIAPDGSVRYAGGYTDRKQGPVEHDLEILSAVRASLPPPSLPVFGCATSDRLRARLAVLPTP